MKLYLTVCAVLVLPALQAQEKLSLKDCITYALKNHASGTIYENQVQIAEKQKLEALSGYLPQVNMAGTLDDNIKRQVTIIPAGAFGSSDQKVRFGNQYATALTVQADQVLYDQSQLAALKAIEPSIELAELKKLRNEDDLIYNTAYYYYQLLGSSEQLKLINENEKKLGEVLSIQKLQYENGALTKVNYNRVQVSYNNVVSQKKMAETNYALALDRLKNAMGIPLEQDLNIVDSLPQDKTPELPLVNDWDITGKPDYRILEKNIRLQEIDLDKKRATVLPTLSAYARYGTNAFGNDFSKAYNNWYNYSTIGLKLNIPLFAGLRRYSQIEQSRLNLMISRQTLAMSQENYKLQLQNARTELLNAYYDLQANKNNIELAQSVLSDIGFQYSKGAATLTDFLNADYAFKEAQANYVNSLLHYLVARIDFERSKGSISDFANRL